MKDQFVTIILAGLPGKIASAIANLTPAEQVHTHALASSQHQGSSWQSNSTISPRTIQLVSESDLGATLRTGEQYVALDFSPTAPTPERFLLWESLGIPAVVGFTGFAPAQARARVRDSKGLVVFAPNLALPIVALQAILRDATQHYAGAFSGFKLQCTESHQSSKKDLSGTARAILPNLAALGISNAEETAIVPVRDPSAQRALGVPEEFLGGHGWHRYEVTSDAGVSLALEHNVNGRSVYAEGAVKACQFARKKWNEGVRGKDFDMMDVLKSSALLLVPRSLNS